MQITYLARNCKVLLTMAASRLQLLSKKFIKPSSPTPNSSRHYKLSLIDQLYTGKYMPLALFYPSKSFKSSHDDATNTSTLLEKSLSKLLTSYYPFAGRLKDNLSIDCNDMGAVFMEARIKCTMSEILKAPHSSDQSTVFPTGLPWSNPYEEGIPLVVQLNHFDCGGKALSLCLTHKLGDSSTVMNFLHDWAAVARGSWVKPSPQLIGASICPPVEDPHTQELCELPDQQAVARRLSFNPTKINDLKARVTSESGLKNPSRFEALSAFLINRVATAKQESQLFKPALIMFTLNFRHLLTPPVPQTAMGNFFAATPFLIADEGDMTLKILAGEFRRKKEEVYKKYKGMTADKLVSTVLEEKAKIPPQLGDLDFHLVSSVCNVPFHNTDFGWGKPLKLTMGSLPNKNGFYLIDDHNTNGVEAIVSMDEKIASEFESDPQILEYASIYK